MTKIKIDKYLTRHVNYTPFIKQLPNSNLKVSIVIPMFKEEDILPTLSSLFAAKDYLDQYEVICVVNYSEDADNQIRSIHSQCLHTINEFCKSQNLHNLYAIDLADVKQELAGVGHARKTGMDEALMRFNHLQRDGLIVCMDGDTVVDKRYIEELLKLCRIVEFGHGYSFSFEHPITIEARDRPIVAYELHLRYYMHALRSVGHPHSIYTVGSAMACTCSGYVQQGGMNQRKAGEDFYFMQKFAKSGKWKMVPKVIVYPSGRASDRVPFGTGKAVGNYNADKGLSTYNVEAINLFEPLFKNLDALFQSNDVINALHPALRNVLADYEIVKHVDRLRKLSSTQKIFTHHFFTWMDAFKVMRILHQLRDKGFLDQPVLEATNEWMKLVEKPQFETSYDALIYFRKLDRP